jgi:hypothetical protein
MNLLIIAILIGSLGNLFSQETCTPKEQKKFKTFIDAQKEIMSQNAQICFATYMDNLKACSLSEEGTEGYDLIKFNMQASFCLTLAFKDAEDYLTGLDKKRTKRKELCAKAMDFCKNSNDNSFILDIINFKADNQKFTELGNLSCEKEVAFNIKRENCFEYLL